MLGTECRTISLVLALLLVANCTKSDPAAYSKGPLPGSSDIAPAEVNQPVKVIIRSVEILASDASGQNEKPVKLETWKDSDDPKVPDLQLVDVLVRIENPGKSAIQHGDLIVLITMDFIFAPTYLYGGDIDKIMNGVSWGRLGTMDDVKMEIVPYLNTNESTQIRIKDFNLSRIMKEAHEEGNILWTWALRINVHLMDRDLKRVALGQAILKIIPSDNRLRVK